MNSHIQLNPNPIVRYLDKEPSQFRKSDIIRYVTEHGIRMVNFMYPADDNRLKTLNFVVNSSEYLDSILTYGERVDGSSLFPFIKAGNSDLYVIPRFSTAFIDPFAEIPTLTMLCEFFDNQGNPLESSPQYTLLKAARSFRDVTGMEFYAMGELEYYVIADDPSTFQATDQRGYHESSPFAKFNDFRTECMDLIAKSGGAIKYGHSEVGNFTLGDKIFEQNEIEFLPVPAFDAANSLMVAKWIIRTLAHRRGYDVTFAPKITAGKAGSGLHIHFKLMREGHNMMISDGRLSDDAKRAIVGILEHAPSLTAMGNKVPTSYFRLVPNQEAPTSICWGDRNRSVLVRVPLGWNDGRDMCSQINPEEEMGTTNPERQTVELRSADGSANVYQLIAGIICAARSGFEMPDALKVADELYVSVDIHKDKDRCARLRSLPDSCYASSDALRQDRSVFEEYGVFSSDMIDSIIDTQHNYRDHHLRKSVENNKQEMLDLVRKYWHCG